jgi:hypothetical protein
VPDRRLGAVGILAMVMVSRLQGSTHRATWSAWAELSLLGLLAGHALTWRALVIRRLRRASDGRCPAVRLRGLLWQVERLTTDTPMLSLSRQPSTSSGAVASGVLAAC